jgi:hypothetical protein
MALPVKISSFINDETKILLFIGYGCVITLYLLMTGQTQSTCQIGEDYLYESIQCHSGVSQGGHLGPIFLILDINGALDIFENMNVLGYADNLKLFMTIK